MTHRGFPELDLGVSEATSVIGGYPGSTSTDLREPLFEFLGLGALSPA